MLTRVRNVCCWQKSWNRFIRTGAASRRPGQGEEEHAPYYTAKDIEFCPNRSKEVTQNNVVQTSSVTYGDDSFISAKASDPDSSDQDHMKAFQAENTVSLYSVMQSNVPEPFCSSSPTSLNMPGSDSSKNCKYMAAKMHNVHRSNN